MRRSRLPPSRLRMRSPKSRRPPRNRRPLPGRKLLTRGIEKRNQPQQTRAAVVAEAGAVEAEVVRSPRPWLLLLLFQLQSLM